MQLIIEDRRSGGRLPLTLESYYAPPWGNAPGDIVTFEGFHPALKGAEAGELRLRGYLLEASGGWVVGCRETLALPQGRYLNFEDLRRRLWKHCAGWRHSGHFPGHALVDVIPPLLPGAGMVIVRNIAALTGRAQSGDHLEQEAARRRAERASLLALGFVEVHDGHRGDSQGD